MPAPRIGPLSREQREDGRLVGTITYQGVLVDVENAPGSKRSGVDRDGTPWTVRMPHDYAYGEIRGTEGADGDALDAFVGPDQFAAFVYVVHMKEPGSKRFDEDKAVLGAPSKEAALDMIRSVYTRPGFVQGCTRWKIGAWRAAIEREPVQGDRMDRPLTKAEQAAMFATAARAPTRHGDYHPRCPKVLASSGGLEPRRWRCAGGHPLADPHARRLIGEMTATGETHVTAKRLAHPGVARLAAEGLVHVHANPAHFNYEHRLELTAKGHALHSAWHADAARRAARAQAPLFKAIALLIVT